MSQKLLKKLQDKKYRDETGLFLVEGKKGISELLLSDFKVTTIYTTLEAMAEIEELASSHSNRTNTPLPEILCVTEDKLVQNGTFRSNNTGIAIAAKKTSSTEAEILEKAKTSLILVLDDIQDPGNLGTILRTADWFGLTNVITSPTTTDPYGPKVINATMGSFTRVDVIQLSLPALLEKAHGLKIPSMGAFLDGRNIFETTNVAKGFLIMGSESHGINEELAPLVTDRITIPRFGKAESLNVASATAVILATLKQK